MRKGIDADELNLWC